MPTAPAFWYQKNTSLKAALLTPASWFYGAGAWLWRCLAPRTRVAAPVICIGNCVVGGSGKTPVVADFAKRFKAQNINVNIISRGYGGVLYGPVKVDPAKQQAYDVGDEPLMLSKIVPVWVSKNRVAGAVAAIIDNAQLLLLDDGLQNHSLRKSASFLVVDGATGIGNGLLLPAGPLRESLHTALKRVKAVVFIGPVNALYHEIAAHKPIFRADINTLCPLQNVDGTRLFAFTGIAHSAKFFNGLEKNGALLVAKRSFPDHYTWPREELEALLDDARKLDAIPVSTAKDITRMPDDLKQRVTLCDAQLVWEDEMALDVFLNTLWAEISR